jgi:DNA-binding FrmR family transcriptional regulator
MSALADEAQRKDMLNRLKRAEGQLRGLQRMITEGEPCLDVLNQMAAARKALDSACVRMVACYLNEELHSRLGTRRGKVAHIDDLTSDLQTLLARLS